VVESVYSAVRTDSLYKTDYAFIFKRLNWLLYRAIHIACNPFSIHRLDKDNNNLDRVSKGRGDMAP